MRGDGFEDAELGVAPEEKVADVREILTFLCVIGTSAMSEGSGGAGGRA